METQQVAEDFLYFFSSLFIIENIYYDNFHISVYAHAMDSLRRFVIKNEQTVGIKKKKKHVISLKLLLCTE